MKHIKTFAAMLYTL